MASQIIRRGVIVEDDWTTVADDQALPEGNAIVSLDRFGAETDALLARGATIGVLVQPTDDIAVLEPHVGALGCIAIAFPKFADGRGYSFARILRDQYGYTGELRATGDVLRDQMFYMHRVGFTAFETAPGLSLESALQGLKDFSVTYQAAADEQRPIYNRGVARPSAS